MKKTALVYSGRFSFVAVDLAPNGVANAVLAVQIGHRNPGLVLLQNPDDLLFPKSGCASCSGPCRRPERTSNWINPVGQGQRHSPYKLS